MFPCTKEELRSMGYKDSSGIQNGDNTVRTKHFHEKWSENTKNAKIANIIIRIISAISSLLDRFCILNDSDSYGMSYSISKAYPQICSTLRLSSYFIPDICDGAGVLKIDIYVKHSSFLPVTNIICLG